jgi:hypothetical protein
MHRTAIALLVYLAGAATACSGGGNGSGDVKATPSGQTLSPGELPTTSAGAATGNVTQGMASVQVAGDLETEFSAPLAVPTAYAPPPGVLALRWVRASQRVEIAGLTFTGTRPTSPALSIVITVDTGEATASFRSTKDECNVTIDTANANQLTGSFVCTGLRSADGSATVDASGRFSASG